MTVFKGYVIIIKRNLGYMALYTGIFLGIMLMMFGFSSRGSTANSMYNSSRLIIAVIDEDNSAFSRGMIACLNQNHDVETEISDRNELVERMYYEELDYVLQIPRDAEELLLEGNAAFQVTKRPGDGMYRGLYADMQIESYLNTYRIYRGIGMEEEQAVEKALKVMEREASVEIRDASGHGEETALYHFYYRYLPFAVLYAFCYMIPFILQAFNRKEIVRRMSSSGVTYVQQGLQGILALGILCVVYYLLLMLLSVILYGSELLQDTHFGYYMLNAACIILVAASIAYLIGNLVKSDLAINGIANVTALSMCFLCGTFVDMDIMGKGVKIAAQFFPVYWYENSNKLLYEFQALSPEQLRTVWLGFAIQIAASLACLTIALIVRRKRVHEE